MPHWPQTIPLDLRRRREIVTGCRSFGPQDLWGEIRELLGKHQVESPYGRPVDER